MYKRADLHHVNFLTADVKAAETVEHFLLQCPNSDLCGKVAGARDSMGVNTVIETILSHGSVLDVICKIIDRQL